VGFNRYKTHPLAKKYNPLSGYLHAEMDAILGAMRIAGAQRGRGERSELGFEDWGKATLYVARAKREAKGEAYHMGNACPCPGCARLIKDVGITSVIHT